MHTHILYTHAHTRTPIHPFTISHLDNTDQLQTTHRLGKLQFSCSEFLPCSLLVCSNHLPDCLVSSCEKASKWLMNIPHMCTFHQQCIRDIKKNFKVINSRIHCLLCRCYGHYLPPPTNPHKDTTAKPYPGLLQLVHRLATCWKLE